MNIDPNSDGSPQPGDEPTWDEADEAMHRLLEEVFDPGEPDHTPRPARYLSPFLPDSTSDPVAGAGAGSELSIGETLGRFRIEGELGRGGFGVVYRATDTHLGRPVALKVPRPDKVQSVALWDRFAREAKLAASLHDEAIVPVLDAGVLDGRFVIVSVYQEGESFSRWLATRHPVGMPPKLAAEIGLRLAGGLRHAHENGVLHRDFKPANVLMIVSPEIPGGWLPKITDFGLGTFHEEAEASTLGGFWQGSPPYMAPEQVLPELGRVDARTDLYALGATLYEMLTGRSVYPCKSMVDLSIILGRGEPPIRPRKLRPNLPVDLETICLKCLERDPDRRYPSAAEVHADLARFLDGRPIQARPVPVWGRMGRWAKRRPSHAALVALSVAATTLTVGLIARHQWQIAAKNEELTQSNAQLESTIANLRSTNARLEVSERRERRIAFAAQLNQAGHELASGHIEKVQAMLRSYEPAEGRADLRDFAWHYLMGQASRIYTVRPLKDLLWWRGARPIAPTLERFDRKSRERIQGEMSDLIFDPGGIRKQHHPFAFFVGKHGRISTPVTAGGEPSSRLLLDDGQRLVCLDFPCRQQMFGPGGQTLVVDTEAFSTSADESPPLVRHPDLVLPALPRSGRGRGGEFSKVRVVEVPHAQDVAISGDNSTVACLASFLPEDGASSRPLIYDLNSDWRAAYPQFVVPIIIYESSNNRSRRVISSKIAVSFDGRFVAFTSVEPRVLVFEARTGRPLWSLNSEDFGADDLVAQLAFSPDGKALVTGGLNGQVSVWEVKTGNRTGLFPVNVGSVSSIGFHPDSNTVAIVADPTDVIRLWDYAPEPELPTVLDYGEEIWGLTFANSGRTLISVGNGDQAKAWDVSSGTILGRLQDDILLSAVAVAGPVEDQSVAIANFDGEVIVHSSDLANGGSRFRFNNSNEERFRALAWSPDARYLVASGNDSRLLIATWDGEVPTSKLMDTPHRDNYGLAFTPDGKTLAIGSHDRSITLRAVPGFHRRATLTARTKVSCVAFSPDGRTLVSGDIAGGLQFWNMADETLRKTEERVSDQGGVWALAFSPDGKTLAIGGDDGVVRLWDPEIASERLALTGHEAKVHALAFSPDGKTLASGDFLGKIRLWHAGP